MSTLTHRRHLFVPRLIAVLAFTATVPACAALGGDDGGADNLPGRGIAGWTPTAKDDRSFALGTLVGPAFGGPSALVDATTSRVDVWFHQRATDGTFAIHRTSSPAPSGADLSFTFDAPTFVLDAARDPSVVRLTDGRYLMAYLDATLAPQLAVSADGQTFTPQAASGLATTPRASPSLVLSAPTAASTTSPISLYSVVDDALVRQTSGLDFAFSTDITVLTPGTDCVDLEGQDATCWDSTAITDAEVRLATTPTGRPVLRVFYAARTGSLTSLGFAASYDGLAFSRYAFNPVVASSSPSTAPTAFRIGDVYHLLYADARNAASSALVHLVSTPGAPSDRL